MTGIFGRARCYEGRQLLKKIKWQSITTWYGLHECKRLIHFRSTADYLFCDSRERAQTCHTFVREGAQLADSSIRCHLGT